MLSKEEIESMKIGLWNIRADILKAMQCSLADTSDKKEWQKEINTIDNALKYIDQLETDKQKLIEKLEKDKMEQFDDYVIYLIESYLEIVKGVENESN